MPRFRSLVCAFAVFALGACGGTVTPGPGGGTTDTGPSDGAVDDGAVADGTPSDGATSQFDQCTGPGECILATPNCCGGCGVPELGDFRAIHRDRAAAFAASVCTDPNPICPGCASQPNPNLVAVCRTAKCTGVDLRADALSACATDSDCTLRAGSACCEACSTSSYDLVAINASMRNAFSREVCGPSIGCPECAPIYPREAKATCDAATKHCKVTTI